MLSKSLIQLSVDGRGCVPSLLFDLGPNYGGGTAPFSWVQVHTRFCLCPPRVCFPSPLLSSIIKPLCYTQYASKFGKLSRSHGTGKGQFSFQSQRKAMPKNAQTTAQLHSCHNLVK